MLAERGIDVSYETVRRWALKFGTIIARKLRRRRPRPDGRWHLDEVFVSVNGKQLYVWRAVDSEGEVLDILVQPRGDRQAGRKSAEPRQHARLWYAGSTGAKHRACHPSCGTSAKLALAPVAHLSVPLGRRTSSLIIPAATL
jgi:hypothetical protein